MSDPDTMGALAAQDQLPDVGAPLIPSGPQSAGQPWANRLADYLTTPQPQPAADPNEPALYSAGPGMSIKPSDIDQAIGIGMGFSGGGLGIKAYHGSPHDFNAFDLSKIGTGEGAQAYGHGMYFAGNEKVAQGYRDTLAGDYFKTPTGRLFDPQQELEHLNVRSRAWSNQTNLDATIDLARQMAASDAPSAVLAQRDLAKLLELKAEGGISRHQGKMYEVDINADPAHFLDWDKPIAQQKAYEALRSHWNNKIGDPDIIAERIGIAPTSPGGRLYSGIGGLTQQQQASSDMLREAGIPGIKYLDQGSRITGDAARIVNKYGSREAALEASQARLKSAGLGDLKYWDTIVNQLKNPETSNYVVFDPNRIKIMRKYGLAGAAPVGIGALAAGAAGSDAKAAEFGGLAAQDRLPDASLDWSRFNQPFGALADTNPVLHQTPYGSIRQSDVDQAIGVGMGFSGGGLKVEPVRPQPAAMPQVAERYPAWAPPVTAFDPVKKKEFLQKALSPEAEAVSAARTTAQRDISAGNYTPYFDPAQRFDVDPANYPPVQSTLTQLSQRPSPERAASYARNAGPEAAARLDAAYARGMQQSSGAGNWYQMGQLENEFIKEYGPVEGPKQFKTKFADAMAATTGGADPTSNLMMAQFGNYLQAKGLPLPARSYDYPFPVGGRYAGGNMEQYRKMVMEGAGVTPANPKRYNFAGNFLGNRAGSTIDEQMMGLIEPGGTLSPPKGAYGHYEGPVAARAAAAGVDPRYYQEVAWAGAKDAKTKGGYTAQPMIGIVNEAIERTHRITGMPKAEIVRRGLVRSEIPLYGVAGATTMGGLAAQDNYQQ